MKRGEADFLETIFSKVDRQEELTKEDALTLLEIDDYSSDFYRLLSKANELSRKEYGNRGYTMKLQSR